MMSNMMEGGAGAAAEAPPADDGKLVSLGEKIDKAQCYARNESSRFPWSNLLIGDGTLGCKSDADEQLIIHIQFQEFVKVHSIKLTEFNSGRDPSETPTVIKLYVNRVNIGFEDVDDYEPTAELELSADDLKEDADPIKLQYVKFQRVKSITLFVEENDGGDVSALGGLEILGRPVATTNMNDFKSKNC
mmetsp:Transcript_20714/g.60245  ORF Transcript_20714/g.60245 Transcript_20714/m.60245 type:complete len:189 (-) Transcript_20714:441-1007(-)